MKKIRGFIKNNWLLILILVVAVFFRFYKLGTIPPGLHPDEAANGQDIIRMIDNHDFRIAYETNGPREALFFYLQGIFVFIGKLTKWAWLYYTPLALRIAPAIVGVVTVGAAYLLGKELFNKNVGLFTAAALAVSSWHVQFSRNGFRAIMVPLVLTFLFYHFIRAYRNGKLMDYIMTGVWIALGFYTYFAFRMVFFALVAILVYIVIKDKNFLKKNAKNILWMFGAFFVAMIPMILHFIHVPADLVGRASTSIFNPELNGGSPLRTLWDNIVKTAGMFNLAGDANWRHNVASLPMLDPLTGILMWLGVVLTLKNIKRFEPYLLAFWFAALTLPEILTAEGIPHALRLVGTIPVVYLWIALGLNWITDKIKFKQTLAVGTIVLMLFSGGYTYWKYFVKFPVAKEAGEAYAEDMVNIAKDINQAPAERRNILIVGEYGTKTIDFITHSTRHTYERYEVYDLLSLNLNSGEYAKIFVQKDWVDEAANILSQRGLNYFFEPVESEINGQILYYAYPYIKTGGRN